MGLSIDIEMLREVASYINGQATNYDGKLEDMYTKFTNLASYWSGKDYDAANAVMTQNKTPLLELGKTLHDMASALNAAADEYEAKINASAAQFE